MSFCAARVHHWAVRLTGKGGRFALSRVSKARPGPASRLRVIRERRALRALPGLKSETRASQPAARDQGKAGASRSPGSQKRDPGQPAGSVRLVKGGRFALSRVSRARPGPAGRLHAIRERRALRALPGLKSETRASQPDARDQGKAGASRSPGSQKRDPGQPAGSVRLGKGGRFALSQVSRARPGPASRMRVVAR
jgi:hypothetical protein